MISVIALFLPAVFSLWIWETITKTHLSRRNWVYLLSLNIILINAVCFAVKKWVFDTANEILSSMITDMVPSAALHYLIMAVPTALILALVEKFIYKKVRLRVEEEKDNV